MLAFSRISFLVSFLAFALFTLALPSKRESTADVESILTNLQSTTQPIVAQLNALNASGKATGADVDPLITDLSNAFKTSTTQLFALPANSGRSIKRQTADDIATLVADIIADVTVALSGTVFANLNLTLLLAELGLTIDELLVSLGVVVDGVLVLVSGLLVGVSGVLDSLGLGAILVTLGL